MGSANTPPIDRYEIFVQEIIKGSTQRVAFMAAFPNSKDWKKASVDVNASKLMKNPWVINRLAELRSKASKTNDLTRDGILSQLKKIGFCDIDMRNIRAVDKIRALELIVKILGYDKLEINTESIEDLEPIINLINRAKERGA